MTDRKICSNHSLRCSGLTLCKLSTTGLGIFQDVEQDLGADSSLRVKDINSLLQTPLLCFLCCVTELPFYSTVCCCHVTRCVDKSQFLLKKRVFMPWCCQHHASQKGWRQPGDISLLLLFCAFGQAWCDLLKQRQMLFPFQIMSNQQNFPQVDLYQVTEASEGWLVEIRFTKPQIWVS